MLPPEPPEKRILLVGSAISTFPPACVPGVPDVKNGILDLLWNALCNELPLDDEVADMRGKASLDIPKLLHEIRNSEEKHGYRYWAIAYEGLVELVWETDKQMAMALMNLNRQGEPNINHWAIAIGMLRDYWSVVYTTNFDELIETAFLEQMSKGVQGVYTRFSDGHPSVLWIVPSTRCRLVKIHGTISNFTNEDDIAELVCRYRDVAKELPKGLHSMMSSDFPGASVSIIGYSGSDLDVRFPLIDILTARRARSLKWFDRVNAIGTDLVSVSRFRNREYFLKKIGGESATTDLNPDMPQSNELLRNIDFKEIPARKSRGTIDKNKPLHSILGKVQSSVARELLGRILDYCASPDTFLVLEPLVQGDHWRKSREIRALAARGLGHAGRYAQYARYLSKNRDSLPEDVLKRLQVDANIALARLMAITQSPTGLLVNSFPCIWAHIRLAGELRHIRRRVPSQGDDFSFLYALLIILHSNNRILRGLSELARSSFVRRMIARLLNLKALRPFDPQRLAQRAKDVADRFQKAGYLEWAFQARREHLIARTHFQSEDYQTLLREFLELERQFSIMGHEPHAVNVLRDMAQLALKNGRLQDCLKFARESIERAAWVPGHEGDVKKAKRLIRKAEGRIAVKS